MHRTSMFMHFILSFHFILFLFSFIFFHFKPIRFIWVYEPLVLAPKVENDTSIKYISNKHHMQFISHRIAMRKCPRKTNEDISQFKGLYNGLEMTNERLKCWQIRYVYLIRPGNEAKYG